MDVSIHNDIFSPSLITEVYNWAKGKSWAAPYRGVHYDFDHDKHNILTDTFAQHGIYRLALGKTVRDIEYNCPLVAEMWDIINYDLFDNMASFEDGISESHGSFSMNRTTTGKNHYEENGFLWNGQDNLHNCYINGRGPRLVNVPIADDETGGLHKDSDPDFYGLPGYFTVIVAINPEWKPAYSGEVLFFDDEEDAMIHPKRGYKVGWPKKVFSQKPGQICVFSSETIHRGISPNVEAPELAMRVAFRIKLKG
tara:strand:- start:33 stop:791 length:759 start_codon:yes stop_codon:yes gene_type:complete